MGESELREQALRINQRYLVEVVQAFDFCPWAEQVSDGAGLRREVLFADRLSEPLHARIAELIESIAGDLGVDIALLIFPNLEVEAAAFRSFVAAMEAAHARAHARHQIPLAMASFHPAGPLDTGSPARLVPFIRRSPDPTIQLVRREAMARVRNSEDEGSVFAESLDAFLPLLGKKARSSVSDNIARNNLRTLERVGSEAIEQILRDIARDREASYQEARLSMTPSGA